MSLWPILLFPHDPITTKVTFNKEVVRILNRRCVGCHSKDGFAPMPLTDYAEARPWAKAIKEEVLERRMPPWNAAQGFGDYTNDNGLTQLETELLVDWVEGGAPSGELKDIPAPVAPEAAPKPDLVVVGAASPVVKAQRWVNGWMLSPGSSDAWGAEFWIEDAAHHKTFLGNWVPPEGPVSWPEDMGQLLPAGSRIVVKVRYREGDTPEHESRLGLFFTANPPKHIIHEMQLGCGAAQVPSGIEALAIHPENPMEAEARLPSGVTDVLGLFRDDKPGYYPTYIFRQPLRLPAGSRITTYATDTVGPCAAVLTYYASAR